MRFADAALTAFYPVMVIFGVTIWLRFLPVLWRLDDGRRTLVCAMLLIVSTIIYEQSLYGLGRLTGRYIDIATNPWLVGLGKLGYISGMCYLLYSFWLLAPARPTLRTPIIWAVGVWAAITVALMF